MKKLKEIQDKSDTKKDFSNKSHKPPQNFGSLPI